MTEDASIAADFFAAAEARVASRDRAISEAARNQFGKLYDDFERELGLILRSVARLPQTLDSRFTVQMPVANSSNRFTFTINCEKQMPLGRITHSITGIADGKAICIESDYAAESDYSRTGSAKVADFASARPVLAAWLADTAAQRLGELKALMLPDDCYTLKRSVAVGSPIRLKTPEGAP